MMDVKPARVVFPPGLHLGDRGLEPSGEHLCRAARDSVLRAARQISPLTS